LYNEIGLIVSATVDSDPARTRIWYELRLANWSPALLDQWQVVLDPSFLGPKDFGTVQLAVEPCCSDAQCEELFGYGATCDHGGGTEGTCTPSFQDAYKPGWPFGPTTPIAAPYLTFTGDAPNGAPLADAGDRHGVYAGTIVIDILNPTVQSYLVAEVALDPGATYLTDAFGQNIPITSYVAGSVGLEVGACCVLRTLSCTDNSTRAACAAQDGLWRSGYTCAEGCETCIPGVCSWGDACTYVEECRDGFVSCARYPNYDTRTECCSTYNGQLFGGPDAKLDPCLQIVCDVPNLTYSFEQLPVGTACDDGDPCTQHTFCTAAGECVGRPAFGPNCPKSRYLSFRMDALEAGGCGDQRAVRVTFVDLPGFAQFNGETRWLSAPGPYPEIFAGETFNGAILQCDPHFDNFGAAGLIHVFGAGVIPGATYEVQTVDTSCADLNDPGCYSPPLVVQTGKWGDIVDLFWYAGGPAQPDFQDIAATVESFVAAPGAPIKARAQLQPNTPNPNANVDFKDIAEAVSAFVTGVYPYDGPDSCL